MARNHQWRARMSRLGLLAFAWTCEIALGVNQEASAQCRYIATPIANYPCANPSDGGYHALAINSSATWVGYRHECPPDYNLIVPSLGGPEAPGANLPVLEYGDAKAYDVNDDGVAVGYVWPLVQQAVVWMPNGEVVVLPLLPGGTWSNAWAVNNSLQVVGVRAKPDAWLGFVWQDGVFHDIDPGRWKRCVAYDISDSGIVVGTLGVLQGNSIAFRWVCGVAQELPPLRGGIGSQGAAVNNSGLVAGRTFFYLPQWSFPAARPTVWHEGTPEELPSHPDLRLTYPRSVNNRGVMVGLGYDPYTRGEIWVNGQLIDLQDLVDSAGAFTVEDAFSINDSGQILVQGNGGKSYVLTPVNPPVADLSGDCAVNATDVAVVLNHWGERNSIADINGDGDVSAVDLAILLGAWTSPAKK